MILRVPDENILAAWPGPEWDNWPLDNRTKSNTMGSVVGSFIIKFS